VVSILEFVVVASTCNFTISEGNDGPFRNLVSALIPIVFNFLNSHPSPAWSAFFLSHASNLPTKTSAAEVVILNNNDSFNDNLVASSIALVLYHDSSFFFDLYRS
jgi:hypothetical protein